MCTVSGSTLTMVAAGDCTATASQTGNTNYAAATPVPVTFAIGQAAQTIVAVATPSSILFGGTSALSSTGFSGTGAITYAVASGGGNCSIAGTALTGTGAGSCTVTATIAADASYQTATSSAFPVKVGEVTPTRAITTTGASH